MKIKLISHTPDPQRMVAMSARLCYSPVGAEDLAENMSTAQVESLLNKIVEMEHLSTLDYGRIN